MFGVVVTPRLHSYEEIADEIAEVASAAWRRLLFLNPLAGEVHG